MRLTRLERISYVGGPWFLGIALIVCGIIVANADPAKLHGILLICTGLLCMCLYSVCALLARIIIAKST